MDKWTGGLTGLCSIKPVGVRVDQIDRQTNRRVIRGGLKTLPGSMWAILMAVGSSRMGLDWTHVGTEDWLDSLATDRQTDKSCHKWELVNYSREHEAIPWWASGGRTGPGLDPRVRWDKRVWYDPHWFHIDRQSCRMWGLGCAEPGMGQKSLTWPTLEPALLYIFDYYEVNPKVPKILRRPGCGPINWFSLLKI